MYKLNVVKKGKHINYIVKYLIIYNLRKSGCVCCCIEKDVSGSFSSNPVIDNLLGSLTKLFGWLIEAVVFKSSSLSLEIDRISRTGS